jgi:hypothetical protein
MGNCAELQGHIFDCSDYKQADTTFVHTLKRISKHVGAEYKHGGDIRSSIINKAKIDILLPPTPVYTDPSTAQDETRKLIFKGLITSYTKRQEALDDYVPKAYSLVLGQCTNLLQSKLKQ